MKMSVVLDSDTTNTLLETGGHREVNGYIWAKCSQAVEELCGAPVAAIDGVVNIHSTVRPDMCPVTEVFRATAQSDDHREFAVFYFEHKALSHCKGGWDAILDCHEYGVDAMFANSYVAWLATNGLVHRPDNTRGTLSGLLPGTVGFAVVVKLPLQ